MDNWPQELPPCGYTAFNIYNFTGWSLSSVIPPPALTNDGFIKYSKIMKPHNTKFLHYRPVGQSPSQIARLSQQLNVQNEVPAAK